MVRLRFNVLRLIILLTAVTTFGTVGYYVLEDGWSLLDAFYMTVITITTIGFGEIHPLSPAGRLFTVLLIMLGLGAIAYSSQIFIEYVLNFNLTHMAQERRRMREINKLQNHYIICGYGRVGENAALAILRQQKSLVVVDNNEERVETLKQHNLLYLIGNATEDAVLRQAGIERAAGLVVCTGSDADNLFIILSARSLNPQLYIVGRASSPDSEAKMIRVGANKVVSPYSIGGQRMGSLVIRPNVAEVMDIVLLDSGLELWLEGITIKPESPLAGHTLGESQVRQKTGATIVLLRRQGAPIQNPSAETRLFAHDQLIVWGTREQLALLEALATG